MKRKRFSVEQIVAVLKQAELRQRMREQARTRVRYGYRRLHVLLKREG